MNDIYYPNDRPLPASWLQNLQATFNPSPSHLSALAIGVFVLLKTLQLLGYPVWAWLRQLVRMAADASPIPIPSLSGVYTDSSFTTDPGNIMGTVFGLNSGSLLRGVTGALSKYHRKVPAGLGNWDNSCYQNSVIQAMASLPAVRDYLSKTTSRYRTLDANSTNGALFDMINKLNNPKHHGQHFWIRGMLKSMSTFQQQDAQEYYSKILDALDREVQDASNKKRWSRISWLSTPGSLNEMSEPTEETNEKDEAEGSTASPEQTVTTPNPLDGLLAQRVGCLQCGYTEGLSLITFNCITVPLGSNFVYDIRDCLDQYTDLERIEGVECARCTLLKTKQTLSRITLEPGTPLADRLEAVQEALDEEDFDDKTLIKKCKILKKNWQQSTKSRQAVIARAPKSLVLHINRSEFNEVTGAQTKNDARVIYPKILDLGNWCLGTRPSHSENTDESIEESWPRDPNVSMIGGRNADPVTDSPFQYRLRAAITHFGDHGYGHYVCYRQHSLSTKSEQDSEEDMLEPEPKEDTTEPELKEEAPEPEPRPSEEQWWRLSDDNVYEVSELEALHQGNVFMLFYERIDRHPGQLPPTQTEPIDSTTSITSEQTHHPLAAQEELEEEASDAATAEEALQENRPLSSSSSPLLPPEIPPDVSLPDHDPAISSMELDTNDSAISSMELDIDDSAILPIGQDSGAANTPDLTNLHGTPPPALPEDIDTSEAETTNYDSEDAPSTQLTSDDDAEMGPPRKKLVYDGEEARGGLPMAIAA